MTKFLLITELDQALVGDPEALHTLNIALEQHRQQHGTLIVYTTGRSQTSFRQLQASCSLLEPNALIAAVGTEIYGGSNPTPLATWTEKVQQGWQRSQVVTIAAQFAALTLQSPTEQGPFKVSYGVASADALICLPQLETALQDAGLEAQLIFSGGKYLDILPRRGDKGAALQFLRQQYQMSAFRTVIVGVSATDIAAFCSGGERGIILGRSELAQWHLEHPVRHHYIAEKNYAAGIMAGLNHFQFLP